MFGKKKRALARAQGLLKTVRLLAAESARQLLDREPTLGWVGNQARFERIVTIACLGLAILREKGDSSVLAALDVTLDGWDPTARLAVKDMLSFVENASRQPSSESSDDRTASAIGVWVLWNVKATPNCPSDSELLPATKVGALVGRIGSCWDLA